MEITPLLDEMRRIAYQALLAHKNHERAEYARLLDLLDELEKRLHELHNRL